MISPKIEGYIKDVPVEENQQVAAGQALIVVDNRDFAAKVAQAEAAQEAALQNYQQTIQNAFADVDNVLVANQKLSEQLAAQQKLVTALKTYERLATLQYNGGYAPYSTVLQAQQSLFPAELTLANVRASVLASSVNIYKAMGGGWVTIASSTTAGGSATKPLDALQKLPPLF